MKIDRHIRSMTKVYYLGLGIFNIVTDGCTYLYNFHFRHVNCVSSVREVEVLDEDAFSELYQFTTETVSIDHLTSFV